MQRLGSTVFMALLAVLALAVAVVALLRRRGVPPPGPDPGRKSASSLGPETRTELSPPPWTPVAAPPRFTVVAERFSGLFTALQMAADGEMPPDRRQWILKDWERRIEQTDDAPLQDAWSRTLAGALGTQAAALAGADNDALVRAARAWLEQLREWGVMQDGAESIVVNDESVAQYVIYEEGFQSGMRARVVHGCWHFGNRVVEKGLATLSA